jgi:hypothetical protein
MAVGRRSRPSPGCLNENSFSPFPPNSGEDPTMRITLLLCMIALLTGCPKPQSSPPPIEAEKAPAAAPPHPPTKASPPEAGMDSPIIISDGSTHLRYKTFQTDSGDSIFIQDSGYFAFTLTCAKDVSGCVVNGKPISMVATPNNSWTLDVLHADGATEDSDPRYGARPNPGPLGTVTGRRTRSHARIRRQGPAI